MTTFLVVMFCLYIVQIVYKSIQMSISDYPRQVEYTIGEDLLVILISIGMGIWVGILIL